MALTVAGVRTAIRNTVESAEPRSRPYQTTLTNSPGTGGTTLSVGDGDAWQVGDLVETPDGELALVTAISTNNLTVSRSWGAIAAENLASGDVVRKNPRFTVDQIDQAVADIVSESDPRVYNLATETIVYVTNDFYDVADTAMEEVYTAWYIEDGEFRTPRFMFWTDDANAQPKVYLAAAGYTGNIFLNYRKPYTAVTELPNRLSPMVVAGAVYKLYGAEVVSSSTDPGQRTDRTVQGGQEGRDSYWFYREYLRLRDAEVALLKEKIARLPRDRQSQRMRRFRT